MDATSRGQFEEFVAARSAALFRTAYLLTGDRQEAQDMVQAALERACRHWNRVAAAEQPEAYVRRILVNTVKDRWFARRRAAEVRFDDMRAVPDPGPSPFGQVELRRSVIGALARLPAGQRAVIVLRYYEDLTEAEIAWSLNCSVGTVKSQAARGIARLRALLGPDADPAPGGAAARPHPGGDA